MEYIVRRGALTSLAAGALVASLLATSVALEGIADSGVVADETGNVVVAVSRTGYGWHSGIREGDSIVSMRRADETGGWAIVTRDSSGGTHVVAGADEDAGLAGSLPLGVAGLVLGALSLLFLSTRRRWVVPTACVALIAAGVPLAIDGAADSSTAVLGAAALVPAVNVARRLPLVPFARAGLALAFLVFLAAWGVARLTGNEAAEPLETLRGEFALWGAIALFVERTLIPAIRGESLGVMRPRVFDVAAIAVCAVIGLVLMNAFGVSPVIVGALLVAVMAFLPSTRRRLGSPIEEALFGDVREAAAAEAAEAERARLARELHDVPLQELVAVIRRLEIMPGTEAESEHLRALAGHLRNVATELRPPVLDDLGLPAALDYLAEESTSTAMPVHAEVDDQTGFGAGNRPPADVELAMYRIASEAVGNAIRHSGGTAVWIRASVAPHHVDLVIVDDGSGLGPDVARDATKRKRLGLASMRRRAQAIDAELVVDGSAAGTQVRVAWQQ
jgi:signal transduction histidine kinase